MPTNLYGTNDNYHKNNSHVMASLIRNREAKIRSKIKFSAGFWFTLRELYIDDLDAVVFALRK